MNVLASNYIIKIHVSFAGLKGTLPISKIFNDTKRVKEILIWWSTNVIEDLYQNGTTGAEEADINRGSNVTIEGIIDIRFSVSHVF